MFETKSEPSAGAMSLPQRHPVDPAFNAATRKRTVRFSKFQSGPYFSEKNKMNTVTNRTTGNLGAYTVRLSKPFTTRGLVSGCGVGAFQLVADKADRTPNWKTAFASWKAEQRRTTGELSMFPVQT